MDNALGHRGGGEERWVEARRHHHTTDRCVVSDPLAADAPADDVETASHQFDVDGVSRHYWVYRPIGRSNAELPVILDLHGSGESPTAHANATGAVRTAAQGYIVVVPAAAIPFALVDGAQPGTAWNIPGTPLPGHTEAPDGPDDIGFLLQLVARLGGKHGFDLQRVHLRGYSGGARLASLLAGQSDLRIASLCAVAGIRFPPSVGSTPPAVLAIHGRQDAFNPYKGGIHARWEEGVVAAVARWATACGATTATTRSIAPEVEETRYVRGDGTAPVRLIALTDGGHAWPGSTDADHLRRFGRPSRFSASTAHLQFVRDIETSHPNQRRQDTR